MSVDLFRKCLNYYKLAAKISIEENHNPILKELSDINEYDDRIEFAKKRWELLGHGSSRTIFRLNKKLVIKVAHNLKGEKQNKVEMNPNTQRPCTNKLIMADAEGKWIIVRFTDTVSKESFKKIIGVGFDSFTNALYYKFNNESEEWSEPKNYKEIEANGFFKCVCQLILECDMQVGDLDKPSSYGELDGKIVLRDYGLNRKLYDTEYAKSNTRLHKSSE
jgi:hypothetical protein